MAEKVTGEYQISKFHSFKEGLILEMRRITHLRGSAHFTIP